MLKIWGRGRTRLFGLTVAAALSATDFAAAQAVDTSELDLDDAIELPEVVVEGTTLDSSPQKVRQPSPASASRQGRPAQDVSAESADGVVSPAQARELSTTGSAVTVVTGEDLRAQQIRHAADALRSLPGVEVSQTGSFSGLTQVRIRGAEANQTLVLIDGIEVNATSDGAFDFSSLLADDIQSMEVIRGPQSGIYGANAVGGVVNIVTRSGKGPLTARAHGEGGSFASGGVGASLSGGNDNAHGIMSFQYRNSEGFNISQFGDELDGSEISNAFAKGGVQVLPWLKIDGVLRRDVNSGDRDTDGVGPGPYLIQVDNPSNFRQADNMAGADATATLLDGRWIQHFRANYYDTEMRDVSVGPGYVSPFQNDGDRTQFSYISTLKSDMPGFFDSHHALTGLVEHKNEGFTPVTADNVERDRNTTAFAAEYRGQYFDRFDITGSVRFDDNDSFDDFTTYRLAGSYAVPNTPLRLHSSVGTGVKAPTMFELYGVVPDFFVPNPDLVPEESLGWDAGVELTLLKGRVVFDVTYFEADLENEIATSYVGGSSTAINLDGTSHRSGEEYAIAYRLTDNLVLSGAYTHLRATDPDGNLEVRRPEHAGRVDVDYRFMQDKAHLRLGVIYNGTMEDIALTPSYLQDYVTLDSYTVVRLAGSYEVKPGLELFARAENLFDEDYQEIYGYETAGAAVYGGMRITFGGGKGS